MVRDAQRQRVYDAEADAPRGRTWAMIADVQAYVDRLLASALWRRLCPSVTKVVIKPAQWNAVWSRAYPDKSGGTIRLAGGHYDQLLLFHELAHLAQPPDTAWHGPEFCEIYLRLVYRLLGDCIGTALEERFKAHRVQVAPSAVPLRRICLRLHGAARQPSEIVWRGRGVARRLGDPDISILTLRRREQRTRVRGGDRRRPRAHWNLHTFEVFGRPADIRPRVRGGGGDAGQMSLEAFR